MGDRDRPKRIGSIADRPGDVAVCKRPAKDGIGFCWRALRKTGLKTFAGETRFPAKRLPANRGERGELPKLAHRKRTVLGDRRDVIEEKGEVQVNATVPLGLSYFIKVLQEQ